MKSIWLAGILTLTLTGGFAAGADEASDAALFHQIFINQVQEQNPKAAAADVQNVHFVPDAGVLTSLRSNSLEDALNAIRTTDLLNLADATQRLGPQVTTLPKLPANASLTLVVVPGVFAEFIKNKAFQEVFERPSAMRDQFTKLVAKKKIVDRVSLVSLYQPNQLREKISVERSLDQVINMGQIQVGGKDIRVILFGTEFSSLESLGDATVVAALFNERLEKYLALTGRQNLALIGYSRGTILGLEMLAQAQAAGRPWVKDVKAMISLSGVNWGSSLADSAYYDETSPMHKILTDLQTTTDSLQPLDGVSLTSTQALAQNTADWLKFFAAAAANLVDMNKDKTSPNNVSATPSLLQTDPRSPLSIVLQMWTELGLNRFVTDYNANIVRFRYFVSQLLASVKEMTTQARTKWWSTHSVPKNPIYYSLTATMANPDANPEEMQMYKSPLSYGNGSYDDVSLLQNRLDYEKISKISLNDSQVSVAQAAFLPGVMRSLNRDNDGLKTKFLGTAGTHHWGLALREVNKMVGGQTNGFPREALLKALATQVMMDTESGPQ